MTRMLRPAGLAALLATLVLAGCSGDIEIGPPTHGTSMSQR